MREKIQQMSMSSSSSVLLDGKQAENTFQLNSINIDRNQRETIILIIEKYNL